MHQIHKVILLFLLHEAIFEQANCDCPEDGVWPSTVPGSVVTLPYACPPFANETFVTRYCNSDSNWGDVFTDPVCNQITTTTVVVPTKISPAVMYRVTVGVERNATAQEEIKLRSAQSQLCTHHCFSRRSWCRSWSLRLSSGVCRLFDSALPSIAQLIDDTDVVCGTAVK